MAKRYIQNDTAHTLFVGGVMIAPGLGREVDELYLPAGHPAPDGTEAGADAGAGADAQGQQGGAPDHDANLPDLLAQPLRTLVPTLADFSDETLAGLDRLEKAAAAPRVSLLNAIGALQLQRAQQRAGGEPT